MSSTSRGAAAPLSFQYWSDPLCIWAFVGQPKLDEILSAWGDRVAVEYRVVPVFGSVGSRFREGPWADEGPEGRRDATRRLAREHGIDGVTGDVWVEDCPHSSWSCGAAVEGVLAMEASGEAPIGGGARYLRELREHLFLRNRNICHRHEQLAVAERSGIDAGSLERRLDDGSAVALLWEDERARLAAGIRGSPTYVFDGGRAILYGNFPFSVLRAVVAELLGGIDLGGSRC